jgi:3-methylcrotonyl-CoA carboxylase alpha subunit
VLIDEAEWAAKVAAASGDPHSPWHAHDHWWLNADFERELPFDVDGSPHPVRVSGKDRTWRLTVGDVQISARAVRTLDGRLDMILGGVRERVSAVRSGDSISVRRNGATWRLRLADPMAAATEEDDAGGRLVAPIPGQVTQVAAKPGMAVTRGQVMVVLEAMKTVFRLAAPADGVVATVACHVGDSVVEGQLLVGFAENDAAPPPS